MKRTFCGFAAIMLLSGSMLTMGCATGKDTGSSPGGKRDSGRDTFSRTGTGAPADVEYGRGTGSSTGIGTMGSGTSAPQGNTGSGTTTGRDVDETGTGGAGGGSFGSYTSSTRTGPHGMRNSHPSADER